MTVTGETLGERLASEGEPWIDPFDRPRRARAADQEGSSSVIAPFVDLAPKGAIFKRAAADAKLFEHQGRAVVFSSLADLAARIDDPALDVTPQDILVLQNAGPRSRGRDAGSHDFICCRVPKKLAQSGVKGI